MQEYFVQIQIQNDPELKRIADQKAEEERKILEQQKDAEREKHYAHFCEIMEKCEVNDNKQQLIALVISIVLGVIVSIFIENDNKIYIIASIIGFAIISSMIIGSQTEKQTIANLKNYLIDNKELELKKFIKSDLIIKNKILNTNYQAFEIITEGKHDNDV